jgi:uncharacterized protein
MELPSFRFHPDPIRSGSVFESDAKCRRCKKSRGYIYTGPVYSEEELDDSICPWCIADGSAHEKFDATFIDTEAFPDGISPEIIDEIACRTPGFSCWQNEQWLTCCGGAMAFLEPAGIQEIRQRYPRLDGNLMSYIVYELKISGGAAKRMLESLNRDSGPTAYVFQCRQCDVQNAFVDGIFSIEE